MKINAYQRLMSKVKKMQNGCWIFTGGRTGAGYGAIKVDGVQVNTHKFIWEYKNGKIKQPKNRKKWKLVLHSCDNRPCVRLRHLFLGTYSDNAVDAFEKGRRGLTAEQHRLIGLKLRGRPAHNKGVPMSESAKRKLSRANKGTKRSADTCEKMRLSSIRRERRFKRNGLLRMVNSKGQFIGGFV